MKRKLFWLFLFLLIPTLACAQGSRFDSVAQRTVQGFVAPIPGASITVCSAAGTGTPCTPTTTIYLDAGLTQPGPNPFTSDSAGNFGFYAPASTTYKVSITAPGVTGQLITVVLPMVGGGNGSFSSLTVSGKISCKNLNNVRCVDGDNSQGWSGSDFGAWVNSAVSNLPTVLPNLNDGTHTYPQGTVYLFPSSAGSTVSVATTININSPSVRLVGNGSSSLILNCTMTSGDCIRWTTNPFNQSPGAEISGMTILGNGTAASGLHMGDLMNLKWNDIYIKNFTSTSVQDGTGSS